MNQGIEKNKVSVVIPAYNASRYIARAIESVLAQTRPADEIIVIDDGSTDNTAKIVNSFGDKVTLIRQSNAGECAARNTGVVAAAGEWIAFLDADDEWLPDKLKLQMEVLAKYPFLVWVTSNYDRCLCGQDVRKQHPFSIKAKKRIREDSYFEDFFDVFCLNAYGCTDTIVVKKEAIIEAGLFNTGQKLGGDIDMWWRLACRWPQIGYINRSLAVYHLGIPNSASVVFSDWAVCAEMIDRNLKEAEKFNRTDHFKPAALYAMKRWIRSWIFSGEANGIHLLLRRFPYLLPLGYRTMVRMLFICPKLTAKGCMLLSRMARLLRLNRQLNRLPV